MTHGITKVDLMNITERPSAASDGADWPQESQAWLLSPFWKRCTDSLGCVVPTEDLRDPVVPPLATRQPNQVAYIVTEERKALLPGEGFIFGFKQSSPAVVQQ